MPLLKIQTNVEVSTDDADRLLHALTELVVVKLNKPIEYVQVLLDPNRALHFAGTDQPNAYVELRALGLAEDQAKPLSAAICQLLKERLNIPGERVFINFFDVPRALWGWNGSTFA